jgi:1,4-alpha-glucan branching enzyme
MGNFGAIEAAPLPSHGHFHSLNLRLPPLGVLVLTPE